MGKDKCMPSERPKTAYGLISRYRSELMGFATLWVVFYHSTIPIPDYLPKWLYDSIYYIKLLGFGGVDLFLLVSGIGIYQSLQKNSVSRYFKNRITRIYPIWVAFIILNFAVLGFFYHSYFSFKEILGYLTFFGNWSSAMLHQGNWYVYAIMLFYLIAPVPFFLLRDSKRKTLTCAVMVGFCILGATAFFSTDRFLQKHFLIALTRVPIFIIGMYFSASLKDRVMKALDWIICVAGFVIGVGVTIWLLRTHPPRLLWQYGLWWWPFILIAPTMSLLLSKLFCVCDRIFRHWHAVLRFLGKASLEVFLISNFIFKRAIADKVDLNGWQSILLAIAAILAGVVFHLIIKYTTKGVTALYRKLRAKTGSSDAATGN